jgi:NTE family protein
MGDGGLLRGVPVLAGLTDEQRDRLAAEAGRRSVPAGEWVMRQGDEGDSMFVLSSGRLDVVAEGPPETLIRRLRRGAVVGELALLHAGRRTASVRARRDAELLELSRSQFEDLIRREPNFAIGLTRAIGAQLAVSRSPVAAALPPRTIAVVRLDAGAPGPEAVERLAAGLEAAGDLGRLDPPPAAESPGDAAMMEAIERAERDSERVLLVAGEVGDPWTELCLREADLVVALTSGSPAPEWASRSAVLQGCELLVAGGRAPDALVSSLLPRGTQAVLDPAALPGALDSLARRLAGRGIGVVLSGGGARALAHLGVLEELFDAGLVIDRVGGVSLGAVVSGAVATGIGRDELFEIFREAFVASNPTGDYALPLYAMLRGGRVREVLGAHLGDLRIEEMPIRFYCISCDLVAREVVVHRTGPAADAVYASLAIPGVFPPVATSDGHVLVDGGVMDNLPVGEMAGTGEGPVIASDVTGQVEPFRRRGRPGAARITGPARRALTGSEASLPRLGEIIFRTVTVGSTDTVAAARLHSDLVITPDVDGVGLLDWGRLGDVREAGRRAAREALEQADSLPWA